MSTPPPPGQTQRRVLVTGSSIAGSAAAFWLDRAGFDVTVLERAPEPRRGGQNVDVRTLAKEVLERMGLTEAVRAAGTGEEGTRFLDDRGRTVSEFPARDDGGDGPTAELEILRGELARVLDEACPASVTRWFGDHVVSVDQGSGEGDDDGVTVRLAGGDEHRFDLLVVAEGVGSATRGLVMTGDDAPGERRLGMYIAWGTIPREDGDDRWWSWMSAPGSRSVNLRPDNVGTTRAMLCFMSDDLGFDQLDLEEQKAGLRERFGDLGWQTPRILDAFDRATSADELYVEDLRQVQSPTWHRGRVVLLGDAAWCVTPIGGGGTSLALVGAYVLAAELARADDTSAAATTRALEAYEAFMRPLAEKAQDLPPGTPRLANPESRLGVTAFLTATKVAASKPVQAVTQRLGNGPGPSEDAELPPVPAAR